jgi:hypothetical protein
MGGLSSQIAKRLVGCNFLQFFDVFVLIFFFFLNKLYNYFFFYVCRDLFQGSRKYCLCLTIEHVSSICTIILEMQVIGECC